MPRAYGADRLGAVRASPPVVREGLARLGILHQRTLPACPEQNGKQEAWWNSVEGRLLAMLENVPSLTLDVLNHATQAWVEMEYNRARHSEIGEAPAERFLRGPDVGRPSPTAISHARLLATIVDESLTTVLSGLGADELFGGYDRFVDYFYRQRRFSGERRASVTS